MQMLTTSTERFDAIQREAPADCRNNLIHVTKYQAGKNCKVKDSRTKLVENYYFCLL